MRVGSLRVGSPDLIKPLRFLFSLIGTIAAFGGRTIHTYHSEGAGGGHAPDIIVVCGQNNVLPSSTNPTRPYAKNTLDEHLDVSSSNYKYNFC